MFCSGCGKEILNDNVQFCTNCGKKIVIKPVEPQAPIQEALPPFVPQSVPDTRQNEQDITSVKISDKRKASVLSIIIAVLLIICIGMGAYIVLNKDKDKETNATIEQDVDSDSKKQVKNDSKETFESEKVTKATEEPAINTEPDEGEPVSASVETDEPTASEPVVPKAIEKLNLLIRQVDNAEFPLVTLYANVINQYGETVMGLKGSDFSIQEIGADGKVSEAEIEDVFQVFTNDISSVNLILDRSGSMLDISKMEQATNAAIAFLEQMNFDKGDKVGIISFDDYVYLEQSFTGDYSDLVNAINSVEPSGMTALYDAIYTGLAQTYYENGAKCVIAFTDGLENASSYSFDEVVEMAQNTGIPVFIIGIGDECDEASLRSLANACSGDYYYADPANLTEILKEIYLDIYRAQQEYYVLSYKSSDTANTSEFREVELNMSEGSGYSGGSVKEYVPRTTIFSEFSEGYRNMDYILDFSGTRKVKESDLEGLSLAELRIARNEIYARHGRQFKDSMLNKWFYSKNWYLNIPRKYSPKNFDALNPSPLTTLEYNNAVFIREYEDAIIAQRDIFPDASRVPLSEYDLALTKSVLQKALKQVEQYPNTDILQNNIKIIKATINQEEIKY